MKSEAEIRRHRDDMRELLDGVDPESTDEDVQAAMFLMCSHERLLSWVLGEAPEVERMPGFLRDQLAALREESRARGR